MPLVYDHLRRIARAHANDRRDTLQPTALVNEAYLKLINADQMRFEGRTHFIVIAAKAMRQVLIDHVRARNAQKRGGDRDRVPLFDSVALCHDAGTDGPVEGLALAEALDRLAAEDERSAQVVELRFFGELTNDQIAGVLGVSERTVRNDWKYASAWLRRELGAGEAAE